ELGKKLYVKITEVISSEVEDITEKDCIDYMYTVVIDRTFDGYMTEIKTIYGQLQEILGVKIEPAPDEWDRLFNVDFFIKIKDKYIGLQIKPAGYAYIPQIIKEHQIQAETHKKFTAKYGGKVFYVISIKDGDKKKIHNTEVIEEIKAEINRLGQ
ncbi:MAG: MjaI family restriction endonuclease, partial [Planctomycetota bacterium]